MYKHLRFYLLPEVEFRKLQQNALRSQKSDQSEVCGIITTNKNKILKLWFLENLSRRAGAFLIDLSEVGRVQKLVKETGQHIIGSFHSHPISPPFPSPGDLKAAFFKGHELIYDVCGRAVKLWLKKSRFRVVELPLKIGGTPDK